MFCWLYISKELKEQSNLILKKNVAFISVVFIETRPKNHDFTFVTFMVWRGLKSRKNLIPNIPGPVSVSSIFWARLPDPEYWGQVSGYRAFCKIANFRFDFMHRRCLHTFDGQIRSQFISKSGFSILNSSISV